MNIADAHNDFLTYFKTKQEKLNYLYRLSYTNLRILNCVFWTTQTKNIPYKIIQYRKLLNKSRTGIKLIYTLEDIGFINVNDIDAIIKAEVDFCGLVWNNNNKFGGGALENGLLTKLGKDVINKLEKNKVVIDTAHMNEKTFWAFVKITKKPIYNSHSNIYDLCNNSRNLKTNQIKKIIKTNGFIGLSFVKDFIKKDGADAYAKDIAEQIKYFIDRFGDDNLGIGSDFCGTKNLPQDIKNYCQIKNLEKELISLGVSKNVIEKILYKNYYDFLKRVGKF